MKLRKIKLVIVLISFCLISLSVIFGRDAEKKRYQDIQDISKYLDELKTAKGKKKEEIIRKLGWSKNKEAVKPLVDIAEKDEDLEYKILAIERLAILSDHIDEDKELEKELRKYAVPVLNKIIKSRNYELKKASAVALYKIGETKFSIPILEDAILKKGDWWMVRKLCRYKVLKAPGSIMGFSGWVGINNKEGKNLLIKAFRSGNKKVKIEAAKYLAIFDKKREKETISFLKKALTDENEEIRKMAESALGSIGFHRAAMMKKYEEYLKRKKQK